ncbi:hypothetical protein I540_0753 [Mycobacteroides abscessus subsp. bolletii 1513]|uniref:Uncharacterized protein n=1 Tax=Mycobacteroides abscessus subsp. bolletii 1513 TaxID=1299321 RepID=X8E0C3_9MYCO|nr:hypothetical protein I540_0753 [Mycobacteroides abscessus subsp. bolletii 1513]
MRALWVGAGAAIASTWIGRALRDVPQTLGASKGRIAEVAKGSPQYRGGTFHNAEPARQFSPDAETTTVVWDVLTRRSVGTRRDRYRWRYRSSPVRLPIWRPPGSGIPVCSLR